MKLTAPVVLVVTTSVTASGSAAPAGSLSLASTSMVTAGPYSPTMAVSSTAVGVRLATVTWKLALPDSSVPFSSDTVTVTL